MSKLAKALTAAAGNAGGDNLYVEDVFSTYLYEGTGAAHTITNGIDLDGEGGLTWIKTRNTGTSAWHSLSDTERGAGYFLRSDLTNAQSFDTAEFTSFNSDGFTVGNDTQTNGSGRTYASWTFRKAEKFFDVVTYTGNGVAGREIAHNLGSAPAVIIIKSVSFANNWLYNHNFGASGYDLLYLDLTNAKSSQTYASGAIQAQPTDSSFTLKNSSSVNGDGNTYVAYLFASDAGGFGDDGSESIIKCGSYTGNGTVGRTVDFGFEPQWVLFKRTDSADDWYLFDSMRELTTDISARLSPNTSDEEGRAFYYIPPNATGITFNASSGGALNASGASYIYIAIRRPMKTPESGTEVFNADYQGNGTTDPAYVSGFVTDFGIRYFTPGGASAYPITGSRLTGTNRLTTSSTAAQVSQSSLTWDYMNGWYNPDSASSLVFSHMFKRATGFFDVVAYTGTGSATTQAHNLGVAPEFIIVKQRATGGTNWRCYHSANAATNGIALNLDLQSFPSISYWNDTAPTSSVFSVGTSTQVNASGGTYIAYLFATLAGVSKVGSYTGTGSNVDVDCGFSAGARFILIKRTDSTGDWYVWDSVRGIVAGNDPYLLLNSTAAEVTSTDYIDPLSSGFTVTSSAPAALNASGGNYIFLAIS